MGLSTVLTNLRMRIKALLETFRGSAFLSIGENRKLKKNNSKEMTLIADVGIFSFAVDSEGKFWKQIKNCPWNLLTVKKDLNIFSMI